MVRKGKENVRGRRYGDLPRTVAYLGPPCLAFLLCGALVEATAQAPASAVWQTVSPETQLKPAPADERQKLWSQVLKNARVNPGPKLRNPAISRDGLAPDVARALQEQRSYLEALGATSPRAAVNAATRELIADRSRNLRSFSQDPPACREPIIRSVNGKTKGAVFTPTAANNTYRIEGCFFGDAPGTVYLEARSRPHQSGDIPVIPMQLDSASLGAWTDHQINVQLDSGLAGVPDYSVTLVVHPANHRRIKLRDCRFIAARGKPQLLSVIPSAFVTLYPSGVGPRSIRQLEYVSPARTSGTPPKDPPSAFVVRSDPEQFGIGTDNYDFSQLNPGWVVESVQLQTYSVSCPEIVTSAQSFGRWEAALSPRGVTVAFKDSVCTSSIPLSFAFNVSMSQYAIRVWVVGPVGTQPLALVR